MIRPLLAAAGAVVAAVAVPSTTAVAQPPECGPDQATAMAAALNVNWIDASSDKYWDSTPIASNFNPCADLSAVLVTWQKATPNTPVLAFLFHRGEYVGTATQKAYKWTTLNADRSTPDTVVLDYKRAGETALGITEGVTSVRYQWQGDHLTMLDPPPPV
jgi:LppP/LprE lipoprotein